MSELFLRCPDCGSICWKNAGDEYICSNPQCQNYDNIVEPVFYDVRKRRNKDGNSPDNKGRSL